MSAAIPYADIDRLRHVTDTVKDSTDWDILYNVGFSIATGAVIFVIFLVLRRRLNRLYSGNLSGPQTAKLPTQSGWFGAFATTFWTTDSELLGFAGFDAYLQVQTIKLFLGVLMAVAVPVLTVLTPAYYYNFKDSPKVASIYMQMSILHCSMRFLWFPFVVCYIAAAIIYYFVYLFYRNYALLRQAYLKDPSALTSAITLQNLVNICGSVEDARKVASLHNRTVILEGIAEKYGKERLRQLLTDPSGSAIASITFINPRDELKMVASKRNAELELFEEACAEFMNSLVADHLKEHPEVKFDEYVNSLKWDGDSLPVIQKLCDSTCKPDNRPKTKNKAGQQVDALRYHFDRLRKLDKQLDDCVEEYERGYQLPVGDDIPSSAGTSMANEKVQKSLLEQSTLISFKKVTWLRHNLKDLKLTLYGTSQSAVVIMESAKAASAISQTIMSRRPFSLTARMAPAADDVLWENLQLSSSDRSLRSTAGMIMFILANLFFVPIVSFLTYMTQIQKLAKVIPILNKISPAIRATLQGIMAPLLVNVAFNIAPLVLHAIAMYQGKTSKSALEQSVISKFSWFLFFQSFVVIIIASNLVDVVNDIVSGKWDRLLTGLRETFPKKSSLFFNLILQKSFVTMPLMCLKPAPMAQLALAYVFRGKTPRALLDMNKPTDFEPGQDYPQYMIMMMQITLAFMTITPVSLIAGIVHFMVCYAAYRHMAIFSYRTKHESGGVAWPAVCQQVMVGLFLNQLMTLLHFTFRGAALQAVFLSPLLLCTVAFQRFLKSTFACRTEFSPQTAEDDEVVDKLVGDLLAEQSRMLTVSGGEVSEVSEDENVEFIRVKDALSGQSGKNKSELTVEEEPLLDITAQDLVNPYTNPILFKTLSTIVVHPALLAILRDL